MEEMILRVAGAANDSIVDGPGIRLAIFTQGCPRKCPGCHNPETHDPAGGYDMPVSTIIRHIDENGLLDGIRLSGGDTGMHPLPLIPICDYCHEKGLNVWAYSGYTYEQLIEGAAGPDATELLRHCDVLVDGPFVLALRSLELDWRGSSNQRIIDVPASLAAGEVVPWKDPKHFDWD